jgi:hypothetical protein
MEEDGKIFLIKWATEFVFEMMKSIDKIQKHTVYNFPTGNREESTIIPVGNRQMKAKMLYETSFEQFTFSLKHDNIMVYGTTSDGPTFVNAVSANLNAKRCVTCMLTSDKYECLDCQAAKLHYTEVCPGCNLRPTLDSVILECTHRICSSCIDKYGSYPGKRSKYIVECPGCKTTIAYENKTCTELYSLKEWERELSDNSDDSDE